ncbi:MAG TPA: hypothetical protein VK753_11285, partial [Xanthomonadaceae bacterium]|nr:hypothetical protein [Xanthomonadaceae bacterium]
MTELQIQDDRQELNRDPLSGTPGSHPIGTGIGAASGAAAGAAVGSMAGPVGTAVLGVVGAVMGGLAGKGIGEAVRPTTEEVDDTRTLNDLLGVRVDPAEE